MSVLSFTWILKSPVIRNSCGVVVGKVRNAEKSDKNDEKVDAYADESGGRYIL